MHEFQSSLSLTTTPHKYYLTPALIAFKNNICVFHSTIFPSINFFLILKYYVNPLLNTFKLIVGYNSVKINKGHTPFF